MNRDDLESKVREDMVDAVATMVDEVILERMANPPAPLAHLVLKPSWPIALCGANVSEFFGAGAPAMDRCLDCLRIARERGLGRPGWQER